MHFVLRVADPRFSPVFSGATAPASPAWHRHSRQARQKAKIAVRSGTAEISQVLRLQARAGVFRSHHVSASVPSVDVLQMWLGMAT